MLSDEEKILTKKLRYCEQNGYLSVGKFEAIKEAVNLIEKQSKEIEEYKKQLDLDYVDKHFVPIERYNQLEKEIEELKQDRDEYKEEYIKLQNARYYNYISKDKIKAKIEELKELQKENQEELYRAIDYLLTDKIDGIANKICINMGMRDILQSLLEKE